MATDSNYNLQERTTKHGKSVIKLVKKIKINSVNTRIISQVVGSSGSIGANYAEADEAESKKDFIHKMSICNKEIKETQHWLSLLQTCHPELKKEIFKIKEENYELLLIFSKIINTSKKNLL